MKRAAFTLIELLVTIGVLLVLIGIVFVGIGKVSDSANEGSVKTTLGNMKNMIAELEASAGLNGRQPTHLWYNATDNNTGAISVWQDADPDTVGNQPAYAPRVVSSGSNDRYFSDQVANTQRVMALLLAVPKNTQAVNSLSTDKKMEKVPTGLAIPPGIKTPPSPPTPKIIVAKDGTPNEDRTLTPPILLDTWGNPIIFVPAGGLCGVDSASSDTAMWVGGKAQDYAGGAKQVVATVTNPAQQIGPIQSPDQRPFWASAGSDGNFCTADDNVYSFGN